MTRACSVFAKPSRPLVSLLLHSQRTVDRALGSCGCSTGISLTVFREVQVASVHPTWVDGYVAFAISDDKAASRQLKFGRIVTDG